MAFLTVKHSISKAQDTCGYNRVTLIDQSTGKRYTCVGGGYDMLGTCLGQYLQANHQVELLGLVCRAKQAVTFDAESNRYRFTDNPVSSALYGLTYNAKLNAMQLDGGCGFECMVRIARAAGLTVNLHHDKKGRLINLFVG